MAQRKNEYKRDPVESFLVGVFQAIGILFKNIFYGFANLQSTPAVVGLAVCAADALLGYWFKDMIFTLDVPIYMHYGLYGLLLAVPVIYLLVLGQMKRDALGKYDEVFRDIGFLGRDKRYPALVSVREDGKKTVYVFKSNIPLAEWKKARERIETGLDCSIRQINEGKNKRLVELVTVPSDYKIPEKLLWNDSRISPQDGVIVIGESDLDTISFDLNRVPHVLAAGETGSGKSVILRTILWQMINKGCRLFMIDFKGGVSTDYIYDGGFSVVYRDSNDKQVSMDINRETVKEINLYDHQDVTDFDFTAFVELTLQDDTIIVSSKKIEFHYAEMEGLKDYETWTVYPLTVSMFSTTTFNIK